MSSEKYVKSEWNDILPASFFHSNGSLCVKIDDERYARIFFNRHEVKIENYYDNKWDELYVVDLHFFSYHKKDEGSKPADEGFMKEGAMYFDRHGDKPTHQDDRVEL